MAEPTPSQAFELLHPAIQRWIWEQNWSELRDIQELAAPVILERRKDLLIMAGTAVGKTEAAFLPICSYLAKYPPRSIGTLYVGPLKALINDQFGRLESLCKALEIPVHRWHGDVPSSRKKKLLEHPSGILLITPESLEALFVIHGTRIGRLFGDLAYTVVDEIHAFIGNERGRQLQSLLHRLEVVTKRDCPRVGLSATIGSPALAASFLRYKEPSRVELMQSEAGQQEVQLQLRGYYQAAPPKPKLGAAPSCVSKEETSEEQTEPSLVNEAVASHLLQKLSGSSNLIFANRRQAVELLADRLRQLEEDKALRQSFFPHHGSLSRDLRESVETALRESSVPVNVVCTSTLELGIDIGIVSSIAQIGCPPTVASLRQRLGRSGRRGQPSIVRIYIEHGPLGPRSPLQEALRVELVQTIAMVELLIEGWCEPPVSGGLHLSTFVQQLLSLIAQYGGVDAEQAWSLLCKSGPFSAVTKPMFISMLKVLKSGELIDQDRDLTVLLGRIGEKIVNHYSFFTAFFTPEEYIIITESKELGTLPITFPLSVGMLIIFAGRRWKVLEVREDKKQVLVTHAKGGRPPLFSGGAGMTDDVVREKMYAVYCSTSVPAYLNPGARALLEEGRETFARMEIRKASVIGQGGDSLVFPWRGDRVMNTLMLLLRTIGCEASKEGVAILVEKARPAEVKDGLRRILSQGSFDGSKLAESVPNKCIEKYDGFLSDELLCQGYASRNLDVEGTFGLIGDLVGAS